MSSQDKKHSCPSINIYSTNLVTGWSFGKRSLWPQIRFNHLCILYIPQHTIMMLPKKHEHDQENQYSQTQEYQRLWACIWSTRNGTEQFEILLLLSPRKCLHDCNTQHIESHSKARPNKRYSKRSILTHHELLWYSIQKSLCSESM